jgi:hypothetical protein
MDTEFLRSVNPGEKVALLLIDALTGRASRVELEVTQEGKFVVGFPANSLEVKDLLA